MDRAECLPKSVLFLHLEHDMTHINAPECTKLQNCTRRNNGGNKVVDLMAEVVPRDLLL